MRAPFAALMLACTLLAGCSGGGGGSDDGADDSGSASGSAGGSAGSGASVAAPVFTLGDRWVEGTHTSAGKAGTDRRVASFEKVTVNGKEHDAVRLDSQQQSLTIIDIKQWIRESDQAALRTDTSTTYNGYPIQTSTTWDPPCVGFQFPLKAGKTWTTTCTATTSGQSVKTTTKYTVGAMESVTVTAGTFDAYNITVEATQNGQTSVQQQYYASKACNVVKITGDGLFHELESYTCAKGA